MMVLDAALIEFLAAPLFAIIAAETPAKNKNNGAGRVPSSWEYMKKEPWRAAGDSHAS
jgi:hypothetical protein